MLTPNPDALAALDWKLKAITLRGGVPFFELLVGPVAWEMKRLIRFDRKSFTQACRDFTAWATFLRGNSFVDLSRICRQDLVPGSRLGFDIEDMALNNNKEWMVIGTLCIELSLSDIQAYPDVFDSVVEALHECRFNNSSGSVSST